MLQKTASVAQFVGLSPDTDTDTDTALEADDTRGVDGSVPQPQPCPLGVNAMQVRALRTELAMLGLDTTGKKAILQKRLAAARAAVDTNLTGVAEPEGAAADVVRAQLPRTHSAPQMALLFRNLLPGEFTRIYHLNDRRMLSIFASLFGSDVGEMRGHLDRHGVLAATIETFFISRRVFFALLACFAFLARSIRNTRVHACTCTPAHAV